MSIVTLAKVSQSPPNRFRSPLTSGVMKHLLWILIAISILPVAARSQALPDSPEPAKPDVGDWNRVADLARDEEITVARTGGFTQRCRFDGAIPDRLFCYRSYPFSDERSFQIDRAEVKTIRLDQTRRNLRIIVGSAAAAGFVAGAALPKPRGNEYPRYLRGLGGAAIGTLAGFVVAVPVELLIPGKVIYRKPRTEHDGPSLNEPTPSTGQADLSAPAVHASSPAH